MPLKFNVMKNVVSLNICIFCAIFGIVQPNQNNCNTIVLFLLGNKYF